MPGIQTPFIYQTAFIYEDYHLGDYQESSTHNKNTEKPGRQRDSATDSHVDSTNDKAFNLPAPHEYDRDEGNALDYFSDEYAEANSLEEAIEMRGEKAFLKNVEPEDFLDDDSPDPGFYWRIYTCKVMVYRVQGEEE